MAYPQDGCLKPQVSRDATRVLPVTVQAIVHPVPRASQATSPGISFVSPVAPMSVCPSCNQPTSDPEALFCAYCGFALPEGPAARESLPVFVPDRPLFATGATSTQRWQRPVWTSNADPRAVAVGLGALGAAVILAVGLSYGTGSTPADRATRLVAQPGHQRNAPATKTAKISGQPSAALHHILSSRVGSPPRTSAHLRRYRASGYSFAYPSGWRVSQGDQPVANYRETVLESANGAAKVKVDYSPGEAADPAAKASQVEAATSRTPGYRRISFAPTTVNGDAAFAWDFTVADTDPRRADLFVRASSGDFALLAHGAEFPRARSAARAIAASLTGY
jgi:hypothetical protein